MTGLQLIIDRDSLAVSPRGVVTGRLWFTSGARAFPDDAWNDFALVVLGWWTHAIAQLDRTPTETVELYFMDGAFSLRLRQQEPPRLLVEMHDRARKRVVATATVALKDLQRQVARAGQAVLDFCVAQGLSGSDVDVLRDGLAAIRAHLSRDKKSYST